MFRLASKNKLGPKSVLKDNVVVNVCPGCGVEEGKFHEWCCDFEHCPTCGGQLSTCGCKYRCFGYDPDRSKPFHNLPKPVYENGLPPQKLAMYQKFVTKNGRVPFIRWPTFCARCGKLSPRMFMVPDKVWDKYVEVNHRGDFLCVGCFEGVVKLVDADVTVLDLLKRPEIFVGHPEFSTYRTSNLVDFGVPLQV